MQSLRPKHFVISVTQPGDILVTIRESHPIQSLWCDILVMISSWSNESSHDIEGF
jgi:hypothetical protein